MPSVNKSGSEFQPEKVTSFTDRFPKEIAIKVGEQIVRGQYEHGPTGFAAIGINENDIRERIDSDKVLKEEFAALTQTAVHPDIKSTFTNPLVSQQAFKSISEADLSSLNEKRGKYTYIDVPEIPHHPHIGKHCLTVSAVAAGICDLLELGEAETKAVISLALNHDGSKLAELLVERLNELKLDPLNFGLIPGSEAGDILTEAGIGKEQYERLQRAAGLTGHLSIAKFLQVNDNHELTLVPGQIAQKIVHLADDIVSETSVLPVNDRMYASNFKTKYPYLWEKGLAVCGGKDGLALCEIDAGRYANEALPLVGSYADLQVMTTQAISAELLSMVTDRTYPDPNKKLVDLLRDYL